MEWITPLVIILGSFLFLIFTGMPVAFAFLFINLVGAYMLWGGPTGLYQIVLSFYDSLARFTILPIVMFVLMGDIMFRSGVASRMLDVLNKVLGRLPGRLSLVAVAGAALFSTMSGSSIGTTAMLGDVMIPEMEKRGYKKPMTLGPIMGSGGLAMMIPPSSLGVLLAVLAEVSVGGMLIGIALPGVVLALLYAAYVIIRCSLQPDLAPAPAHDVSPTPLSQQLILILKYVLPLGSIVFVVLGFIFLGIATPSESAAMGVVMAIILAAVYKGMNWKALTDSIGSTIRVAGMIFLILGGAMAFSRILAFTGASRGAIDLMLGLPLAPLLIIIAMQFMVLIMGAFMDPHSIMLITLPIFMPIVRALGFDPLWFAVLMLLNIEMGQTSPPFGILCFVMKGVAPPGTTMGDVYRAGLPFLAADLIAMILLIAFPPMVLWLPSLML